MSIPDAIVRQSDAGLSERKLPRAEEGVNVVWPLVPGAAKVQRLLVYCSKECTKERLEWNVPVILDLIARPCLAHLGPRLVFLELIHLAPYN